MDKQTIVVGVSASIACYKILDVIKDLKKKYDVHVIMTRNATRLVDPKEFEKVAGNEVHVETFDDSVDYHSYLKKDKKIDHISLSDIADILLIAPSTANTIGKLANGIADDLLSTTFLATKARVIICPAMNVKMWEHPAVKENIKKLRKMGCYVVDPEYGELACGYTGVGRLADPKRIVKSVDSLSKQDMKERNILVTAGGTVEPIDDVRVITNNSSGKMGISIANDAHMRGAKVTLITGQTSVQTDFGYRTIHCGSAKEMHDVMKKEIVRGWYDVVVHAAAVSDFSVKKKKGKVKSAKNVELHLQPTLKILPLIKKWDASTIVVGFKAEHGVSSAALISSARSSLKTSGANCIVANDVKKNPFGSDRTSCTLVFGEEKKYKSFSKRTKGDIAHNILDEVIPLYEISKKK